MTQPNPLIPPGWHRYDPTCGCAGCERREPSSPYVKVTSPERSPATNVAAIIAISCALIGLLVLPILFGPAAIVAGVIGEHQARTEGRKLMRVSLLAFIIGIGVTLHVVLR